MNIKHLHFYRSAPQVLIDLQRNNLDSLFCLIDKCQVDFIGQDEKNSIKHQVESWLIPRNVFIDNISVNVWANMVHKFKLLNIYSRPQIYDYSDLNHYIGAYGAPIRLSVDVSFCYRDVAMRSAINFSIPLKK